MIPELDNKTVALILIIEALMIASRVCDYSIGVGILGMLSVLIVGYLHLTVVQDKIIPFEKGLGSAGHARERRWMIVIGPILLTCCISLPTITNASGELIGVDAGWALLWASVAIWGLLEAVFRIRL